jgi:hypothetical protein
MQTHTTAEFTRIEQTSGLRLAGFVQAGEPVLLVPLLLRPERSREDARRLVLVVNERHEKAAKHHRLAAGSGMEECPCL